MTAPGHTHVQTPLAGLVEAALTAPPFTDLIDRAAEKPDRLALVGPAGARLFVAAALARTGPLLVVTATGREADDLTAELRAVFGDAVALFPSWETLPHERLSPGVDTVGARLMLLRRLAASRRRHGSARLCRSSSPPRARCCSRWLPARALPPASTGDPDRRR